MGVDYKAVFSRELARAGSNPPALPAEVHVSLYQSYLLR